jgi:hypothetical protein
MINTTTWRPDTCGCEIEYDWDGSVPAEQRVHTVSRVNKKCAAHASTPDIETHFNTVMEENSRKNKHIGLIVDNFSTLTTLAPNGSKILKDNVVNWSYDANRVLQITITGLTTNQKNTLQTLSNTLLGSGKVVVK